ncbi:MAG: hypothetical protein V9G19_06055 [Tetrasphaera sp.]
MFKLFACLLGAGALVAGAAPAGADPSQDERASVAFHWRDPNITESSGLALVSGFFVTANDNGDEGRVFTVDSSGSTVGVTKWNQRPRDVEAVAPAGPGSVWVGDIGDNHAQRSTISVGKVPVGRGTRTVTPSAYTLAYPDGPHNAEALLVHPVTHRLYIATKEFVGASLYAAPPTLRAGIVNRLSRVGSVASVVTDGAFDADGCHLVLRTYGKAHVYALTGLRKIGSATLPTQQQGEGLALMRDNTIYLSSEGRYSDVLRYRLPSTLDNALRATAPDPDLMSWLAPGTSAAAAAAAAWAQAAQD